MTANSTSGKGALAWKPYCLLRRPTWSALCCPGPLLSGSGGSSISLHVQAYGVFTCPWEIAMKALAVFLVVLAAGCEHFPVTPVPVAVTLRPAMFGSGAVAIFSNQSSQRVTVFVEVTNESGERFRTTLDLSPNGRGSIGWMEGWDFEPGDRITISHQSYRSREIRL